MNESTMTKIDDLFDYIDMNNMKYLEQSFENGISIDVQNRYGETPLMRACWMGHIKIVEFLINNGANIYIQNAGETALFLAEIEGYNEIVELLQKNKGK